MTRAGPTLGVWRIGVRGVVTPSTTVLLADLPVAVVGTTTLLETGPLPPDACASTIGKLQSLGLEVVDLHWVQIDPDRS